MVAPNSVVQDASTASKPKREAISTVGRARSIVLDIQPAQNLWSDELVSLHYGDSLTLYDAWERPTVIVSDGAYGILGFEGDTSDHLDIPIWYEEHVKAWSKAALPSTTLWFWNSEIGWAAVHPVLERYGWRYVGTNVWDKGKAHIAGNVDTKRIRQFPVVTELCVQYVFEPRVNGLLLKQWLLEEWKRTGLTLRAANEACGVRDAAVRKYLDQGHLWYFPPPDKFAMLVAYANQHGKPEGRPYFSIDGNEPATAEAWHQMRSKFVCPHGVTNVWQRNAIRNGERVKTHRGKAVHLNQKPLDLMELIIAATSDEGDVIWEPFGGLFTASLAARRLNRRAFAAEVDATYYHYGVNRFISPVLLHLHP
ncbi:MAG: DNA methyltransferase [Caldilineaceae bacterium]